MIPIWTCRSSSAAPSFADNGSPQDGIGIIAVPKTWALGFDLVVGRQHNPVSRNDSDTVGNLRQHPW